MLLIYTPTYQIGSRSKYPLDSDDRHARMTGLQVAVVVFVFTGNLVDLELLL
jgi:hypothetical protein